MYRLKQKKGLVCSLLFTLFASLAWLDITPLTLFVMFVPLLYLQREKQGKGVLPWVLLAFVLWNTAVCWSVGHATLIAPVAIPLVFTVLFGSFFALYNKVWRKTKLSLAYPFLIAGWISAEHLYTVGEISFPWLTLGNGFAITPYFVQWYEYTGVLGGSLWVLIVNILIFESLKKIELASGKAGFSHLLSWRMLSTTLRSKHFIAPAVVVAVPMLYSLAVYFTYEESVDPVEVAIIQPNIDPYNEKFGGLTQTQQEDIILGLAQKAPSTVGYFVAPETALDNSFWIHTLSGNPTIKRIGSFMKSYPNAEFITGAMVRQRYPKGQGDTKPTFTANTSDRLPYYYDTYNSALNIDTTKVVEYYHKSYLVTGVESLPFEDFFQAIGGVPIDLGGFASFFGKQEERTVFTNTKSEKSMGVAICFESVNSGFYSEFVKNGADAMSIITNDGWWKDTPTHRQHLSFALLRAIENRRSIARSANTGVSAIINQRGDIVKSAPWDSAELIVGTINYNDKLTFYTRYGNYIGRISIYIFALTFLYFISYIYKKRSHLN